MKKIKTAKETDVLLIDDDEFFLEVTSVCLRDAGYSLISARNGDEGLILFKKHKPRLVITDIIMPEKEGLEFIIDIRRIRDDVPVIAISGGGRISAEAYLECATLLNVNYVFKKPLDTTSFLQAVKEILKD